ncbi:MAG: hypothetical protein K8L91_20675 [Anaerolineae bacterium]|nr:hypothetical protein [Anaerolineae bacterium]
MRIWRRWLIVVTIGVMVYAAGLMLLPQTMHGLFNALFFADSKQVRRIGEDNVEFIQLVYGVLGAVMIGWMVTLLALMRHNFQTDPRGIWQILVLSIGVWFVVDSGFSVVTGFVEHAVFNMGFLVLYAIPLVGMGRSLNSTNG